MKARLLLAVVVLAATACTQVTVETTTLSGGRVELPSDESSNAALAEAAADICAEHAWAGITEPASFDTQADSLQVTPEALATAVRQQCPDTFYLPLSKAEVDWCGDGVSFGQNFFRVTAAGVDLGIESFAVVEPGLIAKAAARRVELTDYEIELLTAELQTMSESTRFDRDWAQACRTTL